MDKPQNVHLPKTDFPMKANLAQAEPARIAQWKAQGLYHKILQRPAPKGKFTLPDGPPYANGYIHVGHALNKVLKDMVIKYKNMCGYHAVFVPGWDCHGLPIELNVTKKLGPKRHEMSHAEVRQLCRAEAMNWVEKQKSQFERLGVLADWENPWLTLNPAYEADEIRVLAKIFDNGIFYRGEKPVYWCPTLQTALAAAEVEYRNHKSLSIYVKFPITAQFGGLNLPADRPVYFLIWTTTPWTLPANYGVAVNANLTYGFFDTGSEIVILAADLKESVEKETGLQLTKLAEIQGAKLENLKAMHPFLPRESLVVLGDHVTLEAGSGVVHTAPGHGLEDYVVGLKYGLPVVSPVDEAGKYTKEVPDYQGESIWQVNPKIVERLRADGKLVAVKEIEHQYPHNPRSKTPLIFRATPQWFIRMDDEQYPLRQMCLNAAEKDIQYFPKWGAQRLQSMLGNSPDWWRSSLLDTSVPNAAMPALYLAKTFWMCGSIRASVTPAYKSAARIWTFLQMSIWRAVTSIAVGFKPVWCRPWPATVSRPSRR
jgi:isoleucyl-tRNA synthetase